MRLRTKIFLLSVLLVIVILASGFYTLNRQFSNTISDTVRTNFMHTRNIFEQIISYRENELTLRSRMVANLPMLKAALGTRDRNTINTELRKLPGMDPGTDFFVISDNRNQVAAFNSINSSVEDPQFVADVEEYLSGMTSLTDIWSIGDGIYQVAASQVDLSGGGDFRQTGYFVILGDLLDESATNQLKDMTGTDISVGKSKLYATTLRDSSEHESALMGIERYKSDKGFSSIENDTDDMIITDLGNVRHIVQFGELKGQADASYLLSMPYSRETVILTQFRNYTLFLGVISLLLVFIISYFAADRLTGPLAKLSSAAYSIASGNLNKPVIEGGQDDEKGDEISELASSFEQMRIALKHNIQEITGLNDELSDKNSKLKQALVDLKKAQDELINAEKLSTLGMAASQIIHDFKSPMQVVKGMTQLLGMGEVDEQKKGDMLKRIDKAINQMNIMTHDILDFVRGETNLTLETAKLSTLMNEFLLYMSPDLQKIGARVQKDIEFDPELQIDIIKIKRVLENIVRNSMEADPEDCNLKIVSREIDSGVRIRIEDSGPGLPPEIAETIFEPFVTKGKVKGTGLGLAISQKLVTDHKGRISVDAVNGKGAAFNIDIPIKQD